MMRPTRLILASLLAASLLAMACGQGSSTSAQHDASLDGPARDAQVSVALPDVPPGCPPAAGNEIGIGKPCTTTGNECTGGLQCSCKNWFGYTMPAGMPCFCTSVAFGPACSSCGTNAQCCTYDVPLTPTSTVTISACFPAVCAPSNQCPSITP